MEVRYEAPGWPNQVNGHSALTPGLTRLAGSGAQQYKDGVTGQPGTQAIPVSSPGTPQTSTASLALAGTARSSDAPDAFYPNQYWARPQRGFWPGAGMPVSVQSDNLMPVPATDPRGIPSTQFVPVNRRGLFQVASTPNLIRWPNLNAS